MNFKTDHRPPITTSWKFRAPVDREPSSSESPEGLSRVVARILAVRGISAPAQVADFMNPRLAGLSNPFLFKDMDRAVARVADAVSRRESVCVYGDYDADGMTSTALLKLFFHDLGLDVRTFIPDREADGYGLHTSRIDELAAAGVNLVICVDCGIKSVFAAEHARALGIDLVILDHHQPGDSLPDVCAVVDPHRTDCGFPFKELAAVGIAFFFCGALRRTLAERGAVNLPDIRDLLDLVAIGTVADVMPLVQDNRILVRAGLERINSKPRPGIAALKAVSDVRSQVTSGAISYKMAPRLNASGRMSNPETSLNLLVAADDRAAATWAEHLDLANSQRKEVGMFVLEEARRQIFEAGGPDARAVVVAGHGWHAGVLGIVAARLVEEFRVPAVVLGIDNEVATGSGRSVPGFDLGASLAGLEGLLLRTGGHPMAAGLALRMERFDEFKAAFKRVADETIDRVDMDRQLDIDAVVRVDDISVTLAADIACMEPFGLENPEPLLVAEGVKVKAARKVGRDGNHMKMLFESGGRAVDAIWFGGADSGVQEGQIVDVAFNLTIDSHSGAPSMKVQDIRPAEA